jgi:hypothetical protein
MVKLLTSYNQPKRRPHPGNFEGENLQVVHNYLVRFGYLRKSQHLHGNLSESTIDAVRRFQLQHGLNPSGRLTIKTLRQITTHRCGMPDMRSGRALSLMCIWQQNEVAYCFTNGTDDVPANEEYDAVRRAFGTWQPFVPFSFRETPRVTEADITITWVTGNDSDFQFKSGIVAHSDFPLGCSRVTKNLPLPLHFNNENYRWGIVGSKRSVDVETAALHEIGHLLGLDHSNIRGTVMFSELTPGLVRRSLTADDLERVQRLYST